jgi:hypothetical protein
MQKKSFWVLATLSVAFFSQSLFAFDGSICSSPIEKICNETKQIRKERDQYVETLKLEILKEANKSAEPRIAEMKKNITAIHFIKRMIQTYKIRNQEIMRVAKSRVGDLESVVTNAENISKIKNYLYQAIDESKFDEMTKESFKNTIKSIVVGNFADYIEKTGLDESVILQFLGNACGSDGLVDNAFATTLKGEKYVLVCPGFLISLKQQADSKERFNSILHAISHEMGHHIDGSKVDSRLYAPYRNCLAKNYAGQFKRTKKDEKFCKENAKDPQACNRQVVDSHSGELEADQWGILVTAIHAKSEMYSNFETEAMLTSSWAKLCGTGDEGIHPTGDFRIEKLMSKNINIRHVLSCSDSELDEAPACGFEGELKSVN